MFSLRFREGSSLNSGCPSEVLLLEDDPEAMTLLCNCLHFQTDHIPRNMEFSPLFRANPHLTLHARQANVHVTPRLALNLPVLTGLHCLRSTTSPLKGSFPNIKQ